MKKQRPGLVRLDPEKIERLRIQNGLSQEQLAIAAGLTRNTITGWVQGGACFPKSAKLLADALGVDVDFLIRRDPGTDGGGNAFSIPGTEEWAVAEYLSEWKPTSNGLQYRVCRLVHKSDPRQWGRGKFYDLLGLPTAQCDKLRHYLTRHFQVCGRVASHEHVAENVSCVPAGGRTGWWVIDRWVDGQPLSDSVQKGPWPVKKLVSVMTQIAKGLQTLHEAGVIFRELAPARILIAKEGQRAVLTDFELAKILENVPSVSMQWPDDPYRAPEVEGGQVTPQADVFSWAKILVYTAAGCLPSRAEERDTIALLPAALRDLANACLSASYRKRPNVTELLSVLTHCKQQKA